MTTHGWQVMGNGDFAQLTNGQAAAAQDVTSGQTPYQAALDQLREAAIGPNGHFSLARFEARGPEVAEWCRQTALEILRRINDDALNRHARPAFAADVAAVAEGLLSDLLGLGPLEQLLNLDDVEDVAVNGPRDIWFKRRSRRWEKSPITYPDAQTLQVALNRAIVHSGRQVGPLTPIIDASLKSGDRLNIVSEPCAQTWPTAAIRKHREAGFTVADLVRGGGERGVASARHTLPNYFEVETPEGLLTALSATFLHMAVIAGLNILVIGATGVGKTALVSALGRLIPADRRVVVIEDTRELNFRGGLREGQVGNVAYFLTRPAGEGVAPITQRDLVLAALRQRPDALTLGEARGGEAYDLLKALWTGHANGLTSLHADSVEDVPTRIRMMLHESNFQTEVTELTTALWIAKAFNLVISLRLSESQQRQVAEIAEFTGGVEGQVPVRTPLFLRAQNRERLLCTGHRLTPEHEARLQRYGFKYDAIVHAARDRGEHL
jgi:pilus assembly protein CpaF